MLLNYNYHGVEEKLFLHVHKWNGRHFDTDQEVILKRLMEIKVGKER